MKSSKLWKIVWVTGIYIILAIILYLVILYKVKWEDKDLNTYLYFYDCNKSLCTSTTKQDEYYDKILCDDDFCPHVTNVIGDNKVILSRNDISWIYNYKSGAIIDDKYVEYNYLGNDYIIVTDKLSKQGIIDLDGNVLVNPKYEVIDDFKNSLISYKSGDLEGICMIDGTVKVDAKYEDVILIDDSMFAAKKDNLYQIYSYNDLQYINDEKYEFVASYEDVLFVISNKKIDILNKKLKSTLLMKIDTYYDYMLEWERESLELTQDGDLINFKVFVNENNYLRYTYNIADKKILEKK